MNFLTNSAEKKRSLATFFSLRFFFSRKNFFFDHLRFCSFMAHSKRLGQNTLGYGVTNRIGSGSVTTVG